MTEGVQQQADRCPRCNHMLYTATGQSRRYCIPCGYEDYSYEEKPELTQMLPQPFRPSRISLTYSGEHTASINMMVYAEIDPSRDRHGGGSMYKVWCPFCKEEMSYSKFGHNKIQKKAPRAWTFQDSVGHALQIDITQLTWW